MTIRQPKVETSDHDVVITGMSGRFPESDSVSELAYNLYNGIDIASHQKHWDTG